MYYYADDGPIYFFGGWLSSFHGGYPFVASPALPIERITSLGFRTREHWFQAHKTADPTRFLLIATASTASDAKLMGNNRTKTRIRSDWDELGFDVMCAGIKEQVMQYPSLREKLLGTGDRLIAEDSPTDSRWGIRDAGGGFGGMNLLGKAWMRVREEL
jgi:ribA/ribD-fused uncharacterized protein